MSDVCSSDLWEEYPRTLRCFDGCLHRSCLWRRRRPLPELREPQPIARDVAFMQLMQLVHHQRNHILDVIGSHQGRYALPDPGNVVGADAVGHDASYQQSHRLAVSQPRSEEHTSELQSLMRISYAVFCLK